MSLKKLYNFQESRFTSLSHELRVFIYGAEVTPWLIGDLSVTYGSRDSFNTISFDLCNPKKIWQITRDNLSNIWREDLGEYSEIPKKSIFGWKNNNFINPQFDLKTNTTVLGSIGRDKSSSPKTDYEPPKDGFEHKFRLAVNDCIFGRNDPMRAFMKNPYSSADEWVEIFCGFLQDHPISTNYTTGESTVRVTGYCIRNLLTKMRVQVGPLVTTIDPTPLFADGFFADFLKPGYAKHPFFNYSLELAIKELILGNATLETGKSALPGQGIGSFKMGNVVCYNPSNPSNTLERWHLMTLFGVHKVPFPSSASENLWLSRADVSDLGRITIYSGEDSFDQGPAGRYLHFLLPFQGTGAGNLIQSGPATGQFTTIEWTTRWDVIRDFASKLDFQVTTSPSGDILVEFPMYGFTPHVFTTRSSIQDNILYTDAYRQDVVMPAIRESTVGNYDDDINRGVTPFGLGALLTFELHQIEETLNDEAEEFATIMQVDGGMSLEATQVSGEEANISLRAIIFSPQLVARFGVVGTSQVNIPHLGQRPEELAGGEKGALGIRLGRLALIEYTKQLADSSTWDGTVVFRPFLFPNRPVWLKRTGRIGLLTSVTNRWTIGKSATTSFALNMLMSERYHPEKKRTVYRLPTGASNIPISYKSIWGSGDDSKDTGDLESGVRVMTGTKKTSKESSASRSAPGSGQATDTAFTVTSAGGIPKYDDPTVMYGPFSEGLKKALDDAKEYGIPPITIVSTYRNPQKQQKMRENPGANGVKQLSNGSYVPVGEAWMSLHQYGLAVDIHIQGDRQIDYIRFAELTNRYNIRGGSTSDPVHFEWKVPGGAASLSRLVDNKSEITNTNNAESIEYLQRVWRHLEGITVSPISGISTAGMPPPPSETQEWSAKTPDECSPAQLQESGLSRMSSVIKRFRGTR